MTEAITPPISVIDIVGHPLLKTQKKAVKVSKDKVMDVLRYSQQTSQGLAAQFNCTARHMRRILIDLPVTKTKVGRLVYYSADPASYTTTILFPELSKNRENGGHDFRQMSAIECDFSPVSEEKTTINGDNDSGHAGRETAKQRHRNRKETLRSHTPVKNAEPTMPECVVCRTSDSPKCHSCPLLYAEFERDTDQFVLENKEFRDLLIEQTKLQSWKKKISHGLTWIYPYRDLTLQVGGDVVVFQSADPKDHKHITDWVVSNFSYVYSDIPNLVKKIKNPSELTRDELTVIVTDPDTIRGMEFALSMSGGKIRTYYLKSPNRIIPAFKVYREGKTLRCEFDCRSNVQKTSGMWMRVDLLKILPRISEKPSLFGEFLTTYYNPCEPPIIINMSSDAIVNEIKVNNEIFMNRSVEAIRELVQAHPVQVLPVEVTLTEAPDPLAGLNTEIESLDGFDIDGIVKAFADKLNLDRKAVNVFLAGWSKWAGKIFKCRVLNEDIYSLLTGENEPISRHEIVDAIDQLQKAGLMQQKAGYDVYFTSAGITLGKKLTAKREGVQ
jgi:hypothetical protein